jgi:hypothetical protein
MMAVVILKARVRTRVTNSRRRIRAAGPQLFDRPARRHPTAVHDADPVAESLDQVELMAGEQHWYDAVAALEAPGS